MLRHTQRLRRLTFEGLLCGANPELPPPSQLADVCTRVTDQFTTQCSSSAPLPVALAASSVASLLMQKKLRDAAGVLALHPRQPLVVRAVCDYVSRYPDVFSLHTLREMSEEAKCVSQAAVAAFLQAAVQHFFSLTASKSCEATESDVKAQRWDAQREELRVLVMRYAHFHPHSSAELLRPLCLLSKGTAAEREDVMELMGVAMRQQMIDPADFGHVLDVMLRCGEPRRVASMWSWVQHTSACWDTRAVSAAVVAFAQLGQMDDAVACMQRLAEAGDDPSKEAQVAFLRFLGERSPPLPQYAEQLVNHWHPSPVAQWRGAAQDVGVELLMVYNKCGLHGPATKLLEEAYRANAEAPDELQRFVLNPHVVMLGQRYAFRIAKSDALQQLFLETLLRSPSLTSSRPDVVGLLLCLGMTTRRLPEVYAAVDTLSLDAEAFQTALNDFARSGVARTVQAEEVLACMEEVAARTANVVPPELKVWLQLAKEM